MTRIPAVALGLGLAVLVAQPALAQSGGPKPWIHVHVEEAKGSKVDVNLPLSLVQIALQAAPDKVVSHGSFRLGRHDDLSVSDLRKMWAELKKSGDTDFVTVQDEEGTVTVKRLGELVQVRVDKKQKGEEVRVDVPVSLLDALLASEGETVNFDAAFRELAKRRGDIVTVKDGADTVRVWIDERS